VTRRRRLTLIMRCTGTRKHQIGETRKKFPDLSLHHPVCAPSFKKHLVRAID
jgi:hypothetical protein